MARKRELTVERWSDQMERDLEEVREIGHLAFYRVQMALGHDPTTALFELQIAERWRDAGRQVYDFDPDFATSLLDESWVDLLPDCISRRPHDCFYMKLPHNSTSEGVVVSVVPSWDVLNFDPKYFPGCEEKGVHVGGVPNYERRVIVNTGSEILCLCSFAIPKAFEMMFDDTDLGVYPDSLIANSVAYLCSANADIVASYSPPKLKRRNNAKRRSQATWHDVGYRIGSELRSYEHARSERKPYQGGTVRPHMRRAHWHHYWTGPRDGDRQLVLRWIPPVMVNVKAEGIGSATLHKVC